MSNENYKHQLLSDAQLKDQLQLFYTHLIQLDSLSFDDMDYQNRFLVEKAANLLMQNEARGFDADDAKTLYNSGYMRGVLACFCYYKQGRAAISKLIERANLAISAHDVERFVDRRELGAEAEQEFKQELGL